LLYYNKRRLKYLLNEFAGELKSLLGSKFGFSPIKINAFK